jgi:hypothetical protein
MRLRLLILFQIIATLAPIGCTSPVEQYWSATDAYVLVAVNTSGVPAVALINDYRTLTILADTLRLHSDLRGEETMLLRVVVHQGPQRGRSTVTIRNTFNYVKEGQRVVIPYPCPPTLECLVPPTAEGELSDNGLVLRSLYGELVYRKR